METMTVSICTFSSAWNMFIVEKGYYADTNLISGSGRQRWTFSLVSGQTNVYNIQVSGGRSGCNTYLSSSSCGSDLVDLYNQDDGKL
jgi:hypothetical protein